MWNFLLGYFFTRSLVGERAARTGTLVVILGACLFVLAAGGPLLNLFAKSFLKGVQDGFQKWEHRGQIVSTEHARSGNGVRQPPR